MSLSANLNVSRRILVLMAAYNGQEWLEEQLNSILGQHGVNINVVISVDTSVDNTLEIAEEYSKKHANVTVMPYGEHFGSAGKNFFHLICNNDFSSFDFIAFSDQDDIWLEHKLSNAVVKLQQYDCYSSNVMAFWEDGREILINKAQPLREWDFLFEAAGPGCTYVFKREVAIKLKLWILERHAEITSNVALHDWLIYAFARHHGYRWFIDPEPMMRYRQHANNQVGTNNSFVAAKKRLNLIRCKWYRKQVVSISEYLGLCETPFLKFGLNNGYRGNIYLLFRVSQLRRRLRDRFALAFVLLFNLF